MTAAQKPGAQDAKRETMGEEQTSGIGTEQGELAKDELGERKRATRFSGEPDEGTGSRKKKERRNRLAAMKLARESV